MNGRTPPSLALSLFLAVLFTQIASGSAHADSIWTHLTAQNIGDQPLSFQISVKDVEPFKEFTITVKRKKSQLSPFLLTYLILNDRENQIASCRIEGVRNDDAIVYTFQVAPNYFEKSKFIFGLMAHSKGMPMPSGDFYWFHLREFETGWADAIDEQAPKEPGDQDRAIRGTIVIDSTLTRNGIGETKAICIVNQEKLKALESFFPGYRRLPSSDEAGTWEAKYRVYLDFPGGKSICVTVSENHDAGYWSVGHGDFETKGNFNKFVETLVAAPEGADKQVGGLRRSDPGRDKGTASPNAIMEEEAVRLLFRRIKAGMDGTEPPASWPEKDRRVGSAWVVDIDTSRLPGGYPEQIVIDITGTGGHSGKPKR